MTAIGTTSLTGIALGSTQIVEARIGSTLVWSASALSDDFDRADAASLGSAWVAMDPAPGLFDPDYHLGIVNGEARIVLPDDWLAQAYFTRRARMVATAPDDDGDLEVRIGSKGSGPSIASLGGYITDVYARMTTDFKAGVGLRITHSNIGVVTMAGGVSSVALDGGSFAAGDVARLMIRGNVHTLFVAGTNRGNWTHVTSGAGKRSVGVRMDAARDVFGVEGTDTWKLGARQFSPTLDYVQFS